MEGVFQPNPPEVANSPLIISSAIKNVQIRHFSPKEVEKEIKLLNNKKAPGFDLVTAQMLKELPPKGIMKLTHIFNAAIRLQHIPKSWKKAEIITIPKPGKSLNDVSSYRPISLLPIISKLFEKLFMKRLKSIIIKNKLIPSHQFGFREKHSTIEQVHRVTNKIEKALEEKKVCSAVFLDVAQAFDKVWHEGLLCKLSKLLPPSYCNLIKSFLTDRTFRVRQNDAHSDFKKIRAGTPQGSCISPTLYLLYTADIPKLPDTLIATFADDTAILSTGINTRYSTMKLQKSIDKVASWCKEWRIKLNEKKSQHINFTNKRETAIPVKLNQNIIPFSNTAKYLGMTLDAKLRWKEHIKIKIKQLNIIFKKIKWMVGRKSCLSTYNKVLIYKQVLQPCWMYGIQLWGCSKNSNFNLIQKFQNKLLREIVNAPWYIRNADIHRDLRLDEVSEVRKKMAKKHTTRLETHINSEASKLAFNQISLRRLKRTKPGDLVL